MKPVLYVQYQRNQPVKIKTHFDGQGAKREDPLSDVADVIGAVQALPASPFAGVYPGDITLHAVVDGDEGPALEPDLPLSTLSTGLTARTALVIKSKSVPAPTVTQKQKKTLILPQAGWDPSFLTYLKYDYYILLDVLPGKQRFASNMTSYKSCSDDKTFFKTLCINFGTPSRIDSVNQIMYFNADKIEYRYNCDANAMENVPPGDIFIDGYHPHSWQEVFQQRTILRSCEHVWCVCGEGGSCSPPCLPVPQAIVHLNDCRCGNHSDSDSGSGSDCDCDN
ncbi:hypothetical protein BJ741DRAFT_639584 [Chytriomyces cf. hyalinus JEL632]|nr:hypothetical protein BJ741DRAFT_639584 [Chytriomyces cf. hyalinus JEL632]